MREFMCRADRPPTCKRRDLCPRNAHDAVYRRGRVRVREESCCPLPVVLVALGLLLSEVSFHAGADTTLETDSEALSQIFFALGGPGWHNREGWEVLEEAREQFDDVFDLDGDEVLTQEEFKRGLNVNYVGCRFPPCFPGLKVHNPLFRIPEPENRFALEDVGWLDTQIDPMLENALRQRTDPVRGEARVEGRDKSIDGMLLFKEFFSNFIAADPCLDRWHGITCSEQGRILGLSLPANQLTGTIPPDIGNLTHLRGLFLGGQGGGGIARNSIIGEIPPELAQLYLLQTLELDNNLLSGNLVDAVGALTRLSRLVLSRNRFDGPLPDLSGLSELTWLDISANRLDGSIETLAALTKLEYIDVSYNNFTGDLHAPLVRLPALSQLFSHGNPSADPRPTSLSESAPFRTDFASDLQRTAAAATLAQDKAAMLDLYDQAGGAHWHLRAGWSAPESDPCMSNWFGVFCDDHGRVTALLLPRNNLTGVIPRSLGHLAHLTALALPGNALRGTVPATLGGLGALRTMDLSQNLLSGSLPRELGGLPFLEELQVERNYLSGGLLVPLPGGGLLRMRSYRAEDNRLTGPLPANLSLMLGLQTLHLGANRLSGPVPPSFAKLLSLESLRLDGNMLEGRLPAGLRALPRMTLLDLSGNRIEGVIPEAWGCPVSCFPRLKTLDLSRNRLTGDVPSSLFSLPVLGRLALSRNALSGQLPTSLANANATLISLDLSSNQLSGPLPSALARLTAATSLDLSHNKFTAFVPDYVFADARLRAMFPHRLRLHGNPWACPIRPEAVEGGLTCVTESCPLHFVAHETACVPCPPGMYRDVRSLECSRCPTTFIQQDDPQRGLTTSESCAVWTRDLVRGDGRPASVGMVEGANDNAVKCMSCDTVRELGLATIPRLGGAAAAAALIAPVTASTLTGRGTLTYNGSSAFPDGAIYIGEWRGGAPHGEGALTARAGTFVGSFRFGKKEGKGVLTTAGGDEFSGEWGDLGRFTDGTGTRWGGVLNGFGIAHYRANAASALRAISAGALTVQQVGRAGGTYEGEWLDGEWHGLGAFVAANGDVYAGDFRRGVPHGRGQVEQAKGGFYKGGFAAGDRDGNGTYYYAKGDIYEGGWKRDLRHGFGVQWFWDGRVYEGYWREGVQHGWGRETEQRSGEVFEGEYRAGARHGRGVVHFANGDAFHGTFVDGVRHGDGIYYYADPNGQDVGPVLKASFMFGEPRDALFPNRTDDRTTVTVPRRFDDKPDDNAQFWGIRNSNYLVGDGYAGSG